MSKSGVIFPLCFLALSACALTESPEIIADKTEIVNPVTESQTVSAPVIEPVAAQEPPAVKSFSVEEIRRLQIAMKEIGLDPGPADGIPGDKTRLASERLQAGCARITPLIEKLEPVSANSKKVPGRQETLRLQTELRKAGFNPGPADGIFGAKTRGVAAQLQTHCPMAREYTASFVEQNIMAKPVANSEPAARATKAQAVATAAREESVRKVSAPAAASPEEIRILQLRLRDAGFDPGPFDGVMGPQTMKALQEFEAAQRAGKTKAPAAGISVQY